MIEMGILQIIAPGMIQSFATMLLLFASFYSLRAAFRRVAAADKKRRIALGAFNLIALVGLLGLIYQPKIASNQKQQVRLVTANAPANLDKVDYPSYRIVDQLNAKDSRELDLIFAAEQVLLRHENIQSVEVFGDGLHAADWQAFEGVAIDYHPPARTTGIINPSWPRQINLGEYLNIKGQLQADGKGVKTLRLLDVAGDKVAETQVLSGEYFSFSTKPKLAGLHPYTLQLLDNQQQLISQESIYFHVANHAKANILVIQSSPSFEIKQLQNWAAEQGASILIKTKISQDKFITRKTNLTDLGATELTPQLLTQFDLVIIDGRGVIELNVNESQWLGQAVENGIGVLVIADQVLVAKTSKWPEWMQGFSLTATKEISEVTPYWSNNGDGFTAPNESFIPAVAASFDIKQMTRHNVLVQTANASPLVIQQTHGLGKLAVSLIRETHRWVTSGDKTSYWQNLIHQLGRSQTQNAWLDEKLSVIRYANQRSEVCVYADKPAAQLRLILQSDNESTNEVLLQPKAGQVNRYCGYFWPADDGWFRLVGTDGLQFAQEEWIHIEKPEAWQAEQQRQKIQATQKHQRLNASNQTSVSDKSYTLISPWIFWWLFFISASLLWLERKFE